MVTNKALLISKEIDSTRCKGNWQAIPELARRYKKHNPTGIVLEQSILAENELIKLIQLNRTESIKQIYQKDSPNSISLLKRLNPNLFKSIIQQLSRAFEDKESSNETQLLKQMSRIILARVYFESGEYEKTLDTIQESGLKPQEPALSYNFTIFIQSLSIKAMSFDLLNRLEEAMDMYQQLAAHANQCINLSLDRVIIDWFEEALYRAILLALNSNLPDSKVLNLIRAYQQICSLQPIIWKTYKRYIILKHSISYLSNLYRQGKYTPSNEQENTEQAFGIEIVQLYTTYEKLVYSQAQFPKAGKNNNPIILDFINQFADDFKLVKGSEIEWRGFIDVLNRAVLKTFNSPCINRHLFLALFQLGDYEEAEHALHSYLDLIGLESKAILDTRDMAPALASDSYGLKTPIPNDFCLDNTSPNCSHEIETLKDKVEVLTTACKMYCKELSNGSEAVHNAQLAELVYRSEDQPQDDLGSIVYRNLGVAYGFLATQTIDVKFRSKYHKKSIEALEKALEMNGIDWITYYELAIQNAEMRDISKSIQMITKSLELNTDHLPSWHLLALLWTCPITINLQQSLKVCDAAISKVSESIQQQNWVDFNQDIAELISFQMTQTLLVDSIHGSSAALSFQENLFQIFGKIMIPELIPTTIETNGNGMILSGSLGNFQHEPSLSSSSSELTASSIRGRSRSKSHSQVGRSVSNSSFTGRKFHLAEVFNHPNPSYDSQSVKSVPIQKGSKLNLLIRKPRRELDEFKRDDSTLNTLLESTKITNRPTMKARLNHQRSCKILCDLWLLSANGFLKSSKLDEALKAVSEAENVDWTTHSDVWKVLGCIYIEKKEHEKAIKSFQKGLVTKPNDVECKIWLAKIYTEQGHFELAEGILTSVTQENGWNNAAAWFYLAEIYKKTDRLTLTKDCLFYALELENTTPIQPFSILPRFIS